jgi:deoxyribodipyrimidine photolyase-related protein
MPHRRANREPVPCRHLVLVLGDQLDPGSAAFDGFDPRCDIVWMAEATEESNHVWSHQARIALFLSAMRHFRDSLIARGIAVAYRALDDPENQGTLARELVDAIQRLRPERLIVVEPGEWRVRESLAAAARTARVPLDIRTDRHFLCTVEEFAAHAAGRRQLRMEFFYREMRRKHGVLLDDGQPVGSAWNFDAENRGHFGKQGPGLLPPPISFEPDAITQQVLDLVRKRFADHPGELRHFDWPVTPAQARQALNDFLKHRLPTFGAYQDAMWAGQPYLYHSRLSAALNLKLLDPREVIRAAEVEYRSGRSPLAAVEGFIRQVLGWREYVRGVYWHFMPDYLERNALAADRDLPRFYWTGDTDLNCLRETIGQTLAYGYAHHIQRLMVTGLYALLLGVRPQAVHEWYLAVYVDAVEWVELPNTLGMSQYADGGVMASKPYVASGKYLERMSNYCRGCRYDPAEAVGPTACPFTTLYWDFLMRHAKRLASNPRMRMQLRNLSRFDTGRRQAIQQEAEAHRLSLV